VLLCWGARAIEVDSEPEAKGLTGFTAVNLGLNRYAKLQLVELGFVAARWMVESPYPARARQSGEEGGLPVGLR